MKVVAAILSLYVTVLRGREKEEEDEDMNS